jgi:hypothetical protein
MNTDNKNETPVAIVTSTLLFNPGQVVATPGALQAIQENHCQSLDLLTRHLSGDWGVIPKEDAKSNQWALENGERILSSYPLEDGTRIWIITERDRSVTTFLLPEEY